MIKADVKIATVEPGYRTTYAMKWTDEVIRAMDRRMTSTKTRVHGTTLQRAMNHGNWATTAGIRGEWMTFAMRDSDFFDEAG